MADTESLAMQNRGPTVLTVVTALLCVSTFFIVLRLISRFGVVKRVSHDDYAIILAWVSDYYLLYQWHEYVLIENSSLPLHSRSPFAMERVLDSAVTKPMSYLISMGLSKRLNMPSRFYTYEA